MTFALENYTVEGLAALRKARALDLFDVYVGRQHAEERYKERQTSLQQVDDEIQRRAEVARKAMEQVAEARVFEVLKQIGFASATEARSAIQQAMLDVVSFGTGTLALKLTPAGVSVEAVDARPATAGSKSVSTSAPEPKAWKTTSYTILQEAIARLEGLIAKVGHPCGMTAGITCMVAVELMKLRNIGPDDGERSYYIATMVANRISDYIEARGR